MKVIIKITFCCLIFKATVSMERIHSTDISVKEIIGSSLELHKRIKEYSNPEDLLENHTITCQAMGEHFFFTEEDHQVVDIRVFNAFKELSEKNAVYYQDCVKELVQELYQQKKKKTDVSLAIQKVFRQNMVKKLSDVIKQLDDIGPEHDKQRMNYINYIIKQSVYSVISLVGFAGISYLSWIFYHCSEK
jgi:hypothetical protein